jgi:hypothetical protein
MNEILRHFFNDTNQAEDVAHAKCTEAARLLTKVDVTKRVAKLRCFGFAQAFA